MGNEQEQHARHQEHGSAPWERPDLEQQAADEEHLMQLLAVQGLKDIAAQREPDGAVLRGHLEAQANADAAQQELAEYEQDRGITNMTNAQK
jgi:hypothetical protein